MPLQFARQASGGCAAGKSFYRCAKGPFTGCCSTNPCDIGVCGDDSDSDSKSSSKSSPPTTKISNDPRPADSATLLVSVNSRSLSAATSILSKTSPVSSTFTSISTTSQPTTNTTRQSATPTALNAATSATSQSNDPHQPPVGPIVGGLLGGLAVLALLAALLRYCLQRKAKLRVKLGRDKKEVDKKREKELLEAEAAILEREKYLDAAKLKAENQVRNGGPFAEFGGYPRDDNVTDSTEYIVYQQPSSLPSSNPAIPHSPQPLPLITHTPAPASYSSKVQQHSMPLPSISETENIRNVPSLVNPNVLPIEMPVDTSQANLDQQEAGHQGISALRTIPPIGPLALSNGQRFNGLVRTSLTPSTDFSSVSSNTNSLTNTGSPVSPTQAKELVAPDGVVMRSNLNGSRAQKARPGSVRKHVMSFMEYDTENDSACSSQRSSFRMPAKAYLPGEQTRGA